jgi:hypothetical protein
LGVETRLLKFLECLGVFQGAELMFFAQALKFPGFKGVFVAERLSIEKSLLKFLARLGVLQGGELMVFAQR